jgi:hypothetical protein
MSTLEEEFHAAMLNAYEEAKKQGYDGKIVHQMTLDYRGVKAAKMLLAGDVVQSGLTALWELHRLDLSVEALVYEERFRPLFTEEEVKKAERRLDQYGYFNDKRKS